MSDLNNAIVAASSVVALKASKPKTAREVTRDVSAIVLNDAVKAVRETDSANWSFATSLTAMMLDSLSRKAHRGETEGKDFLNGKDGKLPSAVTKSNNEVLFALQVRCVYTGLQVYLDTKAHVAEIGGMPNGSMVKRLVDGTEQSVPDGARLAKIKAAREYIDAAYVHEGRMLPVTVKKEDLTAGKYPGAKAKAMVSSFATARRMSSFLVKWFWYERRSFITGLEGKTLTVEDIEQIRNIVRDTFGDTFAELETAYRNNKPSPSVRESLFKRITEGAMKKELDKAPLEVIADLARFFQSLHAQRSNGVKDSEIAAGLDGIGDDAPAGYETNDDASDGDDAAFDMPEAMTGTNG